MDSLNYHKANDLGMGVDLQAQEAEDEENVDMKQM